MGEALTVNSDDQAGRAIGFECFESEDLDVVGGGPVA